MRIFKSLLKLGALFILAGFTSVGSFPEANADVTAPSVAVLQSVQELKNREVVAQNNLLFTRVVLKTEPRSSAIGMESRARLFALRNFTSHILGRIAWDRLTNDTERGIAMAIFQESAPLHATVKGLTLVRQSAVPGALDFIYAADAPDEEMTICEAEVAAAIREALRTAPNHMDLLGYLELALRKPDIFDARAAVKTLGASYGNSFPLFLLGLEVPGRDLFNLGAGPNLLKGDATRRQIASLLGSMPYNPQLSLRFVELLLKDDYLEVAKLAAAGSCRLCKSGPDYEHALNLARQLGITPSGIYRHPLPPEISKKVTTEMNASGVDFPLCMRIMLQSLGDLPVQPGSLGKAGIALMSKAAPSISDSDTLKTLQIDEGSCTSSEALISISNAFAQYGFPHIALCLLNQASLLEPNDQALRKKLSSLAGALGIAQYMENAGHP